MRYPPTLLISGLLFVSPLACSSEPGPSSENSGGTTSVASGGDVGSGGGLSSGGMLGSGGSLNASGGALSSGGSSGGGDPAAGGANTGGTVDAAGGSESGGSGSGGETQQGFQPCPQTGPCKILPLGDSITFGLSYPGAYRVELFHLALTDEHDITFTGTQTPNGPSMVDGVPFPKNHEGISGETIQQIDNRVPKPALNDMPHIILLHAGTNDVYGSDPGGAPMRLGVLLDGIIEEAPDALLVVSTIIPLSANNTSLNNLNATVQPMVKERADAGAHILFVDQFTDFPTSELADGVHPNEAGNKRMAKKWYDAIESYLP